MTTPKQWEKSGEAVRSQMAERGVVESDRYLEWTRGDHVSITGEAGVFTFLSVRLDSDGNPVWVNVYGGPSKQEMFRSFTLTRLEKFERIKRRGSRKAAAIADEGTQVSG